MFKKVLIFLLVASSSSAILADEKEDISGIKKVFATIFPGNSPDVVEPSAIKGMYQVVYGAQVFYMSNNGRYVIQGDLIDLEKRKNLTESTRSVQRQKLVQDIKDDTTIVFSPEKVKHRITVFTDIDCGYCQKLHNEIKDYLDLGIQVRYLAFPRAGKESASYYKAVNVWCSSNQQEALTKAKSDASARIKSKIDKKDCKNPVEDHMKLAEQFGVTGTPTIVFDNGQVVPGYVPAPRLNAMLVDTEQVSMR